MILKVLFYVLCALLIVNFLPSQDAIVYIMAGVAVCFLGEVLFDALQNRS